MGFVAYIQKRRTGISVDRTESPQQDNYLRLPQVLAEPSNEAFRPVDYSSFWGVGRDMAHAPTPHRFYQSIDIQHRLAVAERFFSVPKIPSALVIGMPEGRFNSMSPRVDIESGKQMSYGNMATLKSPLVSNYEYAKLMI
jgi:hypothetical protein